MLKLILYLLVFGMSGFCFLTGGIGAGCFFLVYAFLIFLLSG